MSYNILKKTDVFLWMLKLCRLIFSFDKIFEETEFQLGEGELGYGGQFLP